MRMVRVGGYSETIGEPKGVQILEELLFSLLSMTGKQKVLEVQGSAMRDYQPILFKPTTFHVLQKPPFRFSLWLFQLGSEEGLDLAGGDVFGMKGDMKDNWFGTFRVGERGTFLFEGLTGVEGLDQELLERTRLIASVAEADEKGTDTMTLVW